MMKKIIFSLGLSILILTAGVSQDFNSSFFYNALLQLNPSLTGIMDDRWNSRLNILYRDQWFSFLEGASYITKYASIDFRLGSKGKEESFGLGFSGLMDQAGSSAFKTTAAHISASYLRKLENDLYLAAGVEIGWINYRTDEQGFQFDTQYDGFGAFAPTTSSQEQFLFLNQHIFDFNVGILFYGFRDNDYSFSLGASLKHITQPAFSFLDRGVVPGARLNMLSNIHGDYYHVINKGGVKSYFLFQTQLNSNQLQGGVSFIFNSKLAEDAYFSFGPAFRLTNGVQQGFLLHYDALILNTGFKFGNFAFRLTYDANVSGLKSATLGVGALEIGVTSFLSKAKKNGYIYCPGF